MVVPPAAVELYDDKLVATQAGVETALELNF
jgi:hypothetical protein